MGDVNSDGIIDCFDLVSLRQLSGSPEYNTAGDVNSNGKIDKEDLQLLSDYILGKYVQFTEPALQPENIRYYASDAVYQNALTETTNSGFEGESYVNFDNETGSFIEWTVEAPADGNYNIDFRYANGTDINRPVKLIVNGDREYGQYVDFEGTGAWTSWNNQNTVVTLRKGMNTIKAYATTLNGGPNIDYIEISSTDKTAPHEKAVSGKHMENLNRGVVSAHAKNGNLISWRILATDNEETIFHLWKNG